MGIEGTEHNKDHQWQTTANFILSGEKLIALPLRSGTRKGWPLTTFIQHGLEVLVTAIKEKEAKGIQMGKEVQLSLQMAWYYIQDPEDATRKLLKLINKFSKVAGYKINTETCCISMH